MTTTTVSRRHVLASAAVTMTPATTLAASVAHVQHLTVDDPVFAAIERHRQAVQALSAAHKPSDALLEQLSSAERHAFIAWLTTEPTTMPGVVATLQYASRRPYVSPYPGRLCLRKPC